MSREECLNGYFSDRGGSKLTDNYPFLGKQQEHTEA